MNDVDASRLNDKARGAVVIDLASVRSRASQSYGDGGVKPLSDDSPRSHWKPLLIFAAFILFLAIAARS